MSEVFADRLLDAIDAKRSPICVGIDPIFEMLPDSLTADARGQHASHEAELDAIFDFTTRVLRVVAPLVPCVKFQSAYFEKYYWDGVEAYYSLIGEASELGLVVIGDVKRGDIGSTASAYAAAHLAEPDFRDSDDLAVPDAITVNPFCGLDTIEPFVKTAKEYDKGVFVLVRTSNPGSGELQDVQLADGRTWSQMLAEKLAAVAADRELIGSHGFSSIGAVVGATQAHTMTALRKCLPQSIFLLPGYGTQGATAEMTRSAFVDGRGALVAASRSILYAHRTTKYTAQFCDDWERCVHQAVLDMKNDLATVLQIT